MHWQELADQLAQLKAGDEVAVTRYLRAPEIRVIERITPTGRFVVDGQQYNLDGSARGDHWSFSAPRLVLPTDEYRRIDAWWRSKSAWAAVENRRDSLSLAELNALVDYLAMISAPEPA